jgi:hypothetical protein
MSASEPIQHTTSYLQRVQALRDRYPLYSLLDEISKSPVGLSRSIVTVLEFYGSSNDVSNAAPCRIKDITLNNPDTLKKYIERVKHSPSTCSGRLYLLEDPSKEFSEVLGNKLNVDPNTFASYIYCPDRSKAKASLVARNLPSRHLKSHTYSLKYHEIRDLPNDAPQVQSSRVVALGNVPRSISTFQHGATNKRDYYVTGAIRRNVSYWYDLDKTSKTWDGLCHLEKTCLRLD